MELSQFIEWLAEAANGSGNDKRKHIIRFTSPRDYEYCVRLLGPKPVWSKFQPMPMIQAISCTLSPDSMPDGAMLHGIGTIEEDTRMSVHAPLRKTSTGLQSARKPKSAPIIPWGVRHIRAPLAWKKTRGERIRIGVIDTGADYTHPDLRHCLSRGVNILNRYLPPNDDNGHGTHIAGTISAFTRGRGMIGVAPLAFIHPVKAFDQLGSAFVSDIIGGIEWCIENDMDIINMSFGMKTYSKALEAAIRAAHQSGIIVVASSGNEGKRGTIDYPARLPQVIAVGATTRHGRIAPFSNAGKQIDIYAPGEKIYSTWVRGRYNELSGTSMATSHVSGVVALMLSRNPTLSMQQVKTLLKKHGRPIPKPGRQTITPKEIHASRSVIAAARRKR